MGKTDEVVRVDDAIRRRRLQHVLGGGPKGIDQVDVQTGSDLTVVITMTTAQFDRLFDR